MSKINNVYAVGSCAEILGGAIELGESVFAFVKNADEAKSAFGLGASEVFVYENFDDVVKFLQDKDGLVLLPNSRQSKLFAASLGAKLDCGVCTEVFGVEISGTAVKCQKMVYGGLAVATEKINSKLAVVVVNSGTFTPAKQTCDSFKEAKILTATQNQSIKILQKLPKKHSNVDLNKAKKIVAIGRGVAKFEDMQMIKDFCTLIGAELGCTRPIAESEKWMEHERYIGISSVMAKPEIYIAIGVSGQIQHMVGVKDASKIIAINKDKNAPIFSYADCGIVGDLYKVLPEVIKSLK
ncbi:FAD-binding protein [Campylobacter sp. 9BO]|uniref:FAD-binding protein n=1 Tax=Campylobacter sp. 9BO TaxID=3424759 RepID=UPI003D34B140